ncbi:hypothetical protein PHMEG_00034922 [Phytophthora megakarya]|uniref:Uncharacterized protein n=1 Tax=Phytophthora megakarya TaxID=4795 RepID=A0A225UQB8_9STRA|nr:hypothetical protein PHMEG_00034922 [Phytophthora megakarya]
MARTQNTSHTKQRMEEEARREEEVKAAEEDRMQRVRSAQTRSQKAQAIAKVLDKREADDEDGRESADDKERGENNEEGEADEDEGEAGEDEGDASNEGEAVASVVKMELSRWQPSLAKKLSIWDVGDESEEDEEGVKVLVPAFEAGQATWDLFEADLKRYMDGTKQTLVVSENINVNRRNNTLHSQAQYQGREDEDIPLVPTKFKLYQHKYICTHEWRVARARAWRRDPYRCPFPFLAQLAQDSRGQWSIRLAREEYRHNHAISTDVYRSYPAQAGNSRIYDYIRDNSTHRATMDDVRNLVNRIRKSEKQFSDDEAVAEVVLNFNLKCSKNAFTVNENSRGQRGVIPSTTAHMRAIVTHFQKLYNYQPLSIVAMDQFGRGQPGQYSFLETTSD